MKKTGNTLGHKDLTLAGAAAASAKNALCVVKQLPALTDTSDKQHLSISFLTKCTTYSGMTMHENYRPESYRPARYNELTTL